MDPKELGLIGSAHRVAGRKLPQISFIYNAPKMAEPQPANVAEGMDESTPLRASAEDRKAAAAMNALESRAADNDDEGQKPTKQIDTEALGKAISRLELADKAGKAAAGGGTALEEIRREKKEEEQKERERRAKIKVDQAEVGILVEELDLPKGKAMELLRAHEGDFGQAVRAFVRAGV
ncbi:MAG: hypothetical protein Q9163_002606 [Psora crenata]